MSNRDLKALARETLLKWYGSAVMAQVFREILVSLSILIGFIFFGLGMLNLGMLEDWMAILFPDFTQSTAAAVIFFVLSVASMLFAILLYVWMTFGYQKMLLNICRGVKASSGDTFSQFKKTSRPWRVLWVCILRVILTFVVLIVPLFIAGCAIVCGYDRETAMWFDPWRIAIRTLQILSAVWIVYMSIGFSFADIVVIDKPETHTVEALKISLTKVTGGRVLKLVGLMFRFILWILLAAFIPFAALFVLPYIDTTMILYYLDGLGELDQLPAYRELIRKREEEKAQAEAEKAEAAENEAAQPEAEVETKSEVTPASPDVAEPEVKEINPEACAAADLEEEEKPVEMASIPKKIAFPDIDADPNNKPAQTGTEE